MHAAAALAADDERDAAGGRHDARVGPVRGSRRVENDVIEFLLELARESGE